MDIKYYDKSEIFFASKEKVVNLLLIDISINDIVVPCVVDTGASITVLREDIVKKVNARFLQDSITGGGNVGKALKGSLAMIDKVEFGNISIQTLKIAVAPNETLDFGLDDDGNELHINGFIGWDIIRNFKWQYNADNRSFLVTKPVSIYSIANMDEWDNMPIIHIDFNGEDIMFGFDSGNTESVIGDVLFHLYEGEQETRDTFVGIDGISEETVRKVPSFEFLLQNKKVILNSISAVNRTVFPSNNKNICGLLAADVIHNKSWVLDYHNKIFEILG